MPWSENKNQNFLECCPYGQKHSLVSWVISQEKLAVPFKLGGYPSPGKGAKPQLGSHKATEFAEPGEGKDRTKRTASGKVLGVSHSSHPNQEEPAKQKDHGFLMPLAP